MSLSPYDNSLADWQAAGKTIEDWREAGRKLWDKIRASAHYHDGRGCAEVKCSNALKRPAPTPKVTP